MALRIDTGEMNVVEVVILFIEDDDPSETLTATIIPYPDAVPPPRRLSAATLRALADALDAQAAEMGD